MKKYLVAISGILSFFYLINPTAGVFEMIPDVIPWIGNLDEATAAAVLLAALKYFGLDFTNFFKRKEDKDQVEK